MQRKVAAGGLGGALSVIIIAILGGFHVPVDPALSSAITTVVSVLVAYYVPDAVTKGP